MPEKDSTESDVAPASGESVVDTSTNSAPGTSLSLLRHESQSAIRGGIMILNVSGLPSQVLVVVPP